MLFIQKKYLKLQLSNKKRVLFVDYLSVFIMRKAGSYNRLMPGLFLSFWWGMGKSNCWMLALQWLEHSTSFLKINVGTKILTPGSVIFNYTEGLVENSDEEIYLSDEELIEYLLQNKGLPVDSLNKNVLNGIQSANNAAMNSDDSTILTIRVL